MPFNRKRKLPPPFVGPIQQPGGMAEPEPVYGPPLVEDEALKWDTGGWAFPGENPPQEEMDREYERNLDTGFPTKELENEPGYWSPPPAWKGKGPYPHRLPNYYEEMIRQHKQSKFT